MIILKGSSEMTAMEKTEKRRIVTLSIIIINILIWVINVIAGGGRVWGLFISGGGYLKEYGEATFGYIFQQGQWWRLLTCGYLHMGVLHLLCNMYALLIVGSRVEAYWGTVKMVALYNLGIVVTASIWCLIFRNGSIVGASLGIFVLMGILFVLYLLDKGKNLLSRGGKRYLLCYIIGGCFLGMGTVVVHLLGFGVGVLLGYLCIKIQNIQHSN